MRYEVCGPEVLEELRPLWLALRDHHASVTPAWPPVREDDDSWARRRAEYERWFAEAGAFVVVARDEDGAAVGYALTSVHEPGSPTWASSERHGDVQTLSVAPGHRGAGVGRGLLDAVQAHLASLGITTLDLTVVAPNAAARRFYAREGFEERFIHLRRSGPPR